MLHVALLVLPPASALLFAGACTDDYISIRTPTPIPTEEPPSDNARLASLILSSPAEAISPTFDPDVTSYAASVGLYASTVRVVAATEDTAATIAIETAPVPSGEPTDPIPLALGPTTISIVVTAESGATKTYVLQLNRASQLVAMPTYFKASNTDAGDAFGYSVAIDGDTLVIGAPNEASAATGVNGDQGDNSADDAGAAYVFVREAGTWTQQAYLKASNAETLDRFGYRVGISGDTIVVATPGEDSNATGVDGNQANNSANNGGAVYVFVRTAGAWSQQAYLKASNTGSDDTFGDSVAISGDTIVVGAGGEDSNATFVNGDQTNNAASVAGAAYVFVRNGAAWAQQAYLKPTNTGVGDAFGIGVDVSGNTIVIGSVGEDSSATGVNGAQNNEGALNSGAAYVFVRNGTIWTQQAYLKASNAAANDQFGGSVSISGDTVVIGATAEDSAATGVNGDQTDNSELSSGAAYVFTRTGTTWSQQAYVKASNAQYSDYFGYSLAIRGDRLVVGANNEQSTSTGVNGNQYADVATGSGAAYLFTRTGGVWSQAAYLKASNTDPNDLFGTSVALSEDAVLVSATGEDSSATGIDGDSSNNSNEGAGAAYLFQ